MKPQDVITEGNKIIEEIISKHGEFVRVERKIKETQDVTAVDPETLSQCASMITSYLSNLSGVIAKYTSMANAHYIYRKFSYMWEWNSLGDDFKGTKRDNKALEETTEEHFKELVMKYVADYLKGKYDSYQRHVSVLQSRIGLLKSELFRNDG